MPIPNEEATRYFRQMGISVSEAANAMRAFGNAFSNPALAGMKLREALSEILIEDECLAEEYDPVCISNTVRKVRFK